MEIGLNPNYAILSSYERSAALVALRKDGRHDLADALGQTSPRREIELRTIHLISESVIKFANNGDLAARNFMAEINRLSDETPENFLDERLEQKMAERSLPETKLDWAV